MFVGTVGESSWGKDSYGRRKPKNMRNWTIKQISTYSFSILTRFAFSLNNSLSSNLSSKKRGFYMWRDKSWVMWEGNLPCEWVNWTRGMKSSMGWSSWLSGTEQGWVFDLLSERSLQPCMTQSCTQIESSYSWKSRWMGYLRKVRKGNEQRRFTSLWNSLIAC